MRLQVDFIKNQRRRQLGKDTGGGGQGLFQASMQIDFFFSPHWQQPFPRGQPANPRPRGPTDGGTTQEVRRSAAWPAWFHVGRAVSHRCVVGIILSAVPLRPSESNDVGLGPVSD